MAEIIGAALLGLILQGGIFKLLTKRNVKQPLAVAISAIIFVTLYTLIGGFGFANGGSLRFMLAFTIGAPASLVVTVTLYTLIGGFGFANGGSLRFMLAFTIGAPASLVVTVLFLIGISRSR